jgi:hypothetical protein
MALAVRLRLRARNTLGALGEWLAGRLQSGLHRFESGKYLVKKMKVRVRKMYGHEMATGEWYDIYELYTQPRRDYLIFKLYELWWNIMWRSNIETLQDKLYDRTHKNVSLEDWEPPGVVRDCKLFDYDRKNNVTVGEVRKKSERTML